MKEFEFVIHGNEYKVKILSFVEGEPGQELGKVMVNGVEYDVAVKRPVAKTPEIKRVPVVHSTVEGGVLTSQEGASSLSHVKAPLPGVVVKLNCSVGDTVKMGQTLLVLEAMKMQNEIQSPKDGKIKAINIKENQSVIEGEDLIVIE